MSQQLELNTVYNFALRAPSILGTGYNRATLCGIIDFNTAMTVSDVTPLHAAVLQDLPQGTPTNPSKLTYLKIITSAGQVRVIAKEWLASDPVKVETEDITVLLKDVEQSRLPILRSLLVQAGFDRFEIS